WLGHFAGPPHWRHGRADHGEGLVRAAAGAGTLCAGDDVHWRRSRHCCDIRADVNVRPPAPLRVTPLKGGRCLWPGEASSTASLDGGTCADRADVIRSTT